MSLRAPPVTLPVVRTTPGSPSAPRPQLAATLYGLGLILWLSGGDLGEVRELWIESASIYDDLAGHRPDRFGQYVTGCMGGSASSARKAATMTDHLVRLCFEGAGGSGGENTPLAYRLRLAGVQRPTDHVVYPHEVHHAALNDVTAWGTALHVYARLPGNSGEQFGALLDACRTTRGSVFPGFYVESLDRAAEALAAAGAPILASHQQMPWGCRVIAEDPDGRAVEINQREHCPAHRAPRN